MVLGVIRVATTRDKKAFHEKDEKLLLSFANQLAMQLAGVDKNSKDPAGGRIVRTADGQPSGVFLETAESLIYSKLAEAQDKRTADQIEKEKRKALNLAQQACLENGIATFHDSGALFKTIDFYKKTGRKNQRNSRLWVMIW